MITANERFGSQPSKMTASDEQAAKSNRADMANAAGDQLANIAGQAQDVAQEQLDKLADTIRRRPLQAAGVAAGVGFMLALLARR